MLPSVRLVPPTGARWDFDLKELVAVVGDQSHLSWDVTDALVLAPRPPDGDLWTYRPDEGSVTWAQLVALSGQWRQVIDGTFTGRGPSGTAALVMVAVDSSFWTVSASDPETLRRTRDRFAADLDEYRPSE